MTNRARILILLTSSLLSVACTRGVVFSEFKDVPPIGWDKDSVVCFSFRVTDTVQPYDVLLHLRHSDNYPYQNMWLFLTSTNPQGVVTSDTIDFYLADERGSRLGNGRNGHVSMPVLYEQNYHFPDTGTYSLSVRHGMRSDNLRGVSQIGMEILQP